MARFRDLLTRVRARKPVVTDRERDLAGTVHDRPILIAIGWAWYAYQTAATPEGMHEAKRHIALWEGMAGPFTLSELVAAWESSTGLSTALTEIRPRWRELSYPPFPQTDDDESSLSNDVRWVHSQSGF